MTKLEIKGFLNSPEEAIVENLYSDPGLGRGRHLKGVAIRKCGTPWMYKTDFWEVDGNYAGGTSFTSGETSFEKAYMVYLGVKAYCKELQYEFDNK